MFDSSKTELVVSRFQRNTRSVLLKEEPCTVFTLSVVVQGNK